MLLTLGLLRKVTFLQTWWLQEKEQETLDIAPEVDLDDVEAGNKCGLFALIIFTSFSMAVAEAEALLSQQTNSRVMLHSAETSPWKRTAQLHCQEPQDTWMNTC